MCASASSSSSSSAAVLRSVTLRIGEIASYVDGRTQGYRVRVDVVEANLMDPEIFVYQRFSDTTPATDEFSNVASPADLEEYPTNTPATGGQFFRLSYVDLVYRNMDLLQQSLTDLQNDVRSLVESLGILDVFGEPQTITITGDYSSVAPVETVVRAIVDVRDPTADDDITKLYAIGSWWVNRVTVGIWVLVDNTEGDAVWRNTVTGSSSSSSG